MGSSPCKNSGLLRVACPGMLPTGKAARAGSSGGLTSSSSERWRALGRGDPRGHKVQIKGLATWRCDWGGSIMDGRKVSNIFVFKCGARQLAARVHRHLFLEKFR